MTSNSSPFQLASAYDPCGDQPVAIKKILENFQSNKNQQTLLGVTGSGKTFTMANVIVSLGKKTLVLAHNKTLAAQLYSEFKTYFPNNAVHYFISYYDYYRPEAYLPSSDTYIEKDSAVNEEIDKMRHLATQALIDRNDVIVVASVSCIYGIGSPDEYQDMRLTVFVGDVLERDALLTHLVSIQYARNDFSLVRGSFRARGDLVEIFPAAEDSQVIRLEFFDNQVEDISLIDSLTGKLRCKLNKVVIYPTSHYVVSRERMQLAMQDIRLELRGRLEQLKEASLLVEYQRLEQRTLHDLEMMEEIGFCSGIENYSRHLTGGKPGEPPACLMDFFKEDYLLIVDESHMTIPQVGAMYRGDRARKETLVNHGFRLPSALDNRPLKFEEFEKKLNKVLYVSATPATYELQASMGEIIEQLIRPTGLLDPIVEVRDATTQLADLLVECQKTIANGYRILVTTLTKKLAEELTSFYSGQGLKVRYLHSEIGAIERMEILQALREGEFDILVGINLLREGLDLPEVALVGILDADKEGFLRSHSALIQTIGRAARNSNGRVILYAYSMTKSMQSAISETNRRRTIQSAFNHQHGIIPTTIVKKTTGGLLETLRGTKKLANKSFRRQVGLKFDEETLQRRIEELTGQMKACAQELRFEEAAKIRDEIKALKEAQLLL